MLKTLTLALALATTCFIGAADAKAPWEGPQPDNMTQAHVKYAEQAQKIIQSGGLAAMGRYDPVSVSWGWSKGRHGKTPLTNVTNETLRGLFEGNYRIFKDQTNDKRWSIAYHDPDGMSYYCVRSKSRTIEYKLRRSYLKATFGVGGYVHTKHSKTAKVSHNKKMAGWPVIYTPSSGKLVAYYYDRGAWKPKDGWVQKEFPASAESICPKLPKNGKINKAQNSGDFNETLKSAKPISGAKIAFQNDPQNPLTAEMLFWAYPPVR